MTIPGDNELPPEAATTLFDQAFRIWIEPELAERFPELERDDVRAAVVILPPSDSPRTLVNEEAELIAQVLVNRSVDKGEEIRSEDAVGITQLVPKDVDPNAGWLAIAKIGDRLIVSFDFRRNRKTSQGLVDRAGQYLDVAVHALDQGAVGPAIENAFAAMELAVKAEMFLIEDDPTTNHWKRIDWWERWVELGNAPTASAEILETLYRERPAARYGESEIALDPEKVRRALLEVRAMISHASSQCANVMPTLPPNAES